MAVTPHKIPHPRVAHLQKSGFHVWLDFLALASEREPAVLDDLMESCWPAWRNGRKRAAERVLRKWCTRWHMVTPQGAPAEPMLAYAREKLEYRKWEEDNDDSQPGPALIMPRSGCVMPASSSRDTKRIPPMPRALQRVRFEAAWDVWQTGASVAWARERILREFARVLDLHIEQYLLHVVRTQSAAASERRRWMQHLEWFCDYQISGREVREILEAMRDEGADEMTVKKALREVARTLGLRLRPANSGRPAR